VISALFGFWTTGEAVVDRVVAVVNQEIITLSDIEKWKASFVDEIKVEDRLERKERTQEALRKILDRLVEEKLIDQEAKRSGLKMTGKEIDGAIEEIKRRNKLTQEEFERAMAKEGLTAEGLRKQIEKQLLRSRIIGMSVKIDSKIGEKELRDYYQKNKDRYRGIETYRPAHILLHVPKGMSGTDIQEIRKKCQEIREKIRKGEDFGEMAILYSDDASSKDRGDLGFFKKGDLIPVFERESMRLQVNEVSECIQSEFGFHIIKLLDRKGGEPPPFEEVRTKIQAEVLDQEMEKAYKQFLTILKEKAAIEIKL
jgi:parvulin-like peptidyl-prolyl isomerase